MSGYELIDCFPTDEAALEEKNNLKIIYSSLGDHCPRSEALRCMYSHCFILHSKCSSQQTEHVNYGSYMLNGYSMSLQAPSKPAFLVGPICDNNSYALERLLDFLLANSVDHQTASFQ